MTAPATADAFRNAEPVTGGTARAPWLHSVAASRRGAPDVEDAPLWRAGAFEADEWTRTAADEAVAEGPAIVSLERFLAERDALLARNSPLGVELAPGEPLDDLIPHLTRVMLVVLPFPKFVDGRSSSNARLLRERHGFGGEIRATGDVLIDQIPLMLRCGFDAFEVTNPVTRAQLARGFWPDVPFYMQPTGSSQQSEVPAGARPWARRPADAFREAAE